MSQPAADQSAAFAKPSAEPPPCGDSRSELQRAVQLRALESMERQRARANTKPNPLRRIALFALALIPVALLFTAVDGLLRVFHHMNYLYNSPEANPTEPAPAAPAEEEVTSSEPGVVLLQPLNAPARNEPSQAH